MYMINVRQENILKTLLRESKGLTIDELSIKFDVSARTIRGDLKNINNFIKENGQNINYSTEEKIYYINHSDRKNIEKYFSKYELKSDWKPIEANQREVYILFLLIINNKTYITTENIAEELYLSKTAIANDVKKVSKWIFQVVNKKVKTSKANGIIVDLTESEIRLLISSAIYRNYSSDSKYLMNLIKHLTDELGSVERFILFNTLISDYLNNENIVLDHQGIITFVLELIVFVYRIEKGYFIENIVEDSNTYCKFPFDVIEEITGVTLPVNERNYLKSVLGLKQCLISETTNKIVVDPIIERIFHEYITTLNEDIMISFNNFSEDLFSKWKKYLEISIYKKRLAYQGDDYIVEKIKGNYKKYYKLVKPLDEIVYKYTNIIFDEIDYIYNSMYLELMGIRYKEKLNVIIASRYEPVLLMSLIKKLQEVFCDKINVLCTCSTNQVSFFEEKYKKENYKLDFIIATHTVKTESSTSIEYISLPLNSVDIDRINSYF